MAQTFGTAVLAWSPLAGGLLTGKYKRGKARPGDSRYQVDRGQSDIWRRWNDRNFDVIEGLTPIAREKGVPLARFAIAWLMAQPGVTAPIVGPRTREQLDDYLGAIVLFRTAPAPRLLSRPRSSCALAVVFAAVF